MSLKYWTIPEDSCMLRTLWSISGRMIQRWPCVQFTRNAPYVAHEYSGLHKCITHVDRR